MSFPILATFLEWHRSDGHTRSLAWFWNAFCAALRDHAVSMESVLQRTRDPGEPVPVVMTMHDTEEAGMTKALDEIAAVEAVVEPPRMIRIEAL